MLMPPISRYMTCQPWTIRSDANLSLARAMMRQHEIRHLPVLEGGKLVGVVSERDIAVFDRRRADGSDGKVEDVMIQDVHTVQSHDPLDNVLENMAAHKHGCAIVLDRHGTVEGIFTTIDGMLMLVEMLRRDALQPTGA